MSKKVLVVYASRAGTTASVAEEIGMVLRQTGAEVDVRSLKQVKDLTPYQAVVLGSAARIGRLVPETPRFAKKHAKALQGIPAAFFVVCLTMSKDTPENRTTVTGYLEPLRKVKQPVSEGLFAGQMDQEQLQGIWRVTMKNVEKADYRNWDDIRSWAGSLPEKLGLV